MTTLAETLKAAEAELASVSTALAAAETSVATGADVATSAGVGESTGTLDKDPTLPDPGVVHEKHLDMGPTYLGPTAINGL